MKSFHEIKYNGMTSFTEFVLTPGTNAVNYWSASNLIESIVVVEVIVFSDGLNSSFSDEDPIYSQGDHDNDPNDKHNDAGDATAQSHRLL